MGFVEMRASAKPLAMVLIIFGMLACPLKGFTDDSDAAPNPIPILTLSLFPTARKATITNEEGTTVKFDGNCTVDQMDILTSEVTLEGIAERGWAVAVEPSTFTFDNSGTKRFLVTVTVPAGVEDHASVGIIVSGECKVPVIQPTTAAASAVVDVDNTSPTTEWVVRISDPAPGSVFDTNELTISGTASYNLGPITKVEVKVCTGPWTVASGTTEWTIDYDCSYLDDGEHTIYARARSGDELSPTTESKVIQQRTGPATPNNPKTPSGGDVDDGRDYTMIALVAIIILGGAGAAYYVYRKRQQTDNRYSVTFV